MLDILIRLLGRGRDQAPAVVPGKPREPEVRRVQKLRFLHEQDGEPERTLKSAIHSLLALRPDVRRAYLARVDYGDPSAHEVALCIAGPEDLLLVQEIATTFAKHFGRDEHLDTLFLNASKEAELCKVCRPFYEAGYISCRRRWAGWEVLGRRVGRSPTAPEPER